MKPIFIIILLCGVVAAFGQERYYYEIPSKIKATHEIDLNNFIYYNTDTVNFKIESLTLLKPLKAWSSSSLKFMTVSDSVIFTQDSKGENIFLFDIKGNALRKIDLCKIEKHFKITDVEIYNDTLYLVDNKSLSLFKFSTDGVLISNKTLTFNFDDFKVSKKGIFFISRHLDSKLKKVARISLFDHSLSLLEFHFVTDIDRESVTSFSPRFFKGESDDILFSITNCNQIYKLEKNRLSLYLQTNIGDYIINYTCGDGFHYIQEVFRVEGHSSGFIYSYYFPKGTLMKGVRIDSGNALNLSVFWNGWYNNFYNGSYMAFNNMEKIEISNILKMEWAEDHKYIKDELLELIKQVDENNKYVVTRYKVISKHSVYP